MLKLEEQEGDTLGLFKLTSFELQELLVPEFLQLLGAVLSEQLELNKLEEIGIKAEERLGIEPAENGYIKYFRAI